MIIENAIDWDDYMRSQFRKSFKPESTAPKSPIPPKDLPKLDDAFPKSILIIQTNSNKYSSQY